MVAAKSLVVGVLIVAAVVVVEQPVEAGAIIAAGSSGTLYYGSRGPVSSSSAPSATPRLTINVAPSNPPAPAPPPMLPLPPPPSPVQAPPPMVFTSSPAPVLNPPLHMTLSFPAVTPAPATPYDAFVNFGAAPYADQALLATGNAQPWFTSPSVMKAFGHNPSPQEINDFSQTVLARVESTFRDSGLTIHATTDPNAGAGHMLSVVSGLSAVSNPNAVGITSVGHNGFDLIDKLGYANSADQLEWAVAHNVSHELMHAFGGSHHTTPEGNNLDAPISDWSVLTDPNTKFSAASVAEMTVNLRQGGLAARNGLGAQFVDADGQQLLSQPVPEPATLALWGGVVGLVGLIRARSKRAAHGRSVRVVSPQMADGQ